MQVRSHVQITGRALKRWFIAQCIDSLCVALLWLGGLLILRVPWAPLWAILAIGFQFIPHVGGLLSLLGPMVATLVEGNGWTGTVYLLILYAIIVAVDGFLLQPILLRRAAKVPVWAAILVPLVMGFFFQFWGGLLSAPLLAIFYALRAHRRQLKELPPPVEVIPPAIGSHRRPEAQPPVIEEG
jgi:predicted PurR-regulated permease PerM